MNYYNDDNNLIPVDIYTPLYDGGIDRNKLLSAMTFITDKQAGSVLFVRKSDDDYQTWSNFRKVDLGTKRPRLTNCGTFRRRAYHLRHQCNTPLRIQAIDLQLDIGSL